MEINQLHTVADVAEYVQKQVLLYRQYPSKKSISVKLLTPIFANNSDFWKIVIDEGKFRETFIRKLGKKGMKALAKLLYEVDKNHYQEIDFGVD